MVAWFAFLFSAVAVQRMLELRLSRRNAGLMRELGGYEVGAGHYQFLVMLHVAFFCSLLFEFAVRRPQFSAWTLVPAAVFLLLQAARMWCIRSLGFRWNTRIFVVPGMEPVRSGPYRFLRHPNYLVVTLELFFLPLAFDCIWTAALFPLLNLLVLKKRIAVEEQALLTVSSASEQRLGGGVNGNGRTQLRSRP